MLGVHLLDFQALDEGVADRGVLDDPAHLGQVGFGVQGRHRALQTLPVVRRPEVVESRRRRALARGVCHRANLSWTARLRRNRTAARSSALTRLVSAGNAEAMSSKAMRRASGTGAVSVRTQRRIIAPLLKPAVSSQLATPGSRLHSTTRTTPSASTAAW